MPATKLKNLMNATKYEPRVVRLPTDKKLQATIPTETMGFIYCGIGIGKTTLLANLTRIGFNILIIDADKGGTVGMEVNTVSVKSWKEFCDVSYTLSTYPGKYDIVAIDTIDVIISMAREETASSVGIVTPSQIGHGTGWDFENSLIMSEIMKLYKCGCHVVFIGHSSKTEVEDDLGKKHIKIEPNIRGSIFEKIGALCSYILYIQLNGSARLIRTKRSEYLNVKDRLGIFKDMTPLPKDGGGIIDAYKLFFGRG